MKILIVEDEWPIAMMLVYALMDAGHQVLGPARTAGEALKIARAARPDLVLSNINLADDVKGTDLARMLRSELPDMCPQRFPARQLAPSSSVIFTTESCSMPGASGRDLAIGLLRICFVALMV